MKESLVLDSMSGDPMPKPYSGDLRARVIGDSVSGASRRAAAEYYGISPSVVVIWAQRFEQTRPSTRSRASCAGSVALLALSAHKNAGTSFGTRAMFERDRNPL